MAKNTCPVPKQPQILINLAEARRLLAESRTLHDAKVLRDAAQATALFRQQQRFAADAVQDAMALRLEAERKLGEMLRETVKHGGDRKSRLHGETLNGGLPEDVSKTQSHRWQKVSLIPEEKFQGYLADAKAGKFEPTTAGILRLAKQHVKAQKNGQIHTCDTCTVDDLDKLISQGKQFGTIYADPPWSYSNQSTRAATDNHYKTMSVVDIAALPVAKLAAPSCHLHLWITNAFLFEAPKIFAAWGFEYKSVFVWVKPQMGIGNYWRVSHEFLLLGIRGRDVTFPESEKNHLSWGQFDRIGHSRKPEPIRKILERVSPAPRLELFGRRPATGWVVWGNQIERQLYDQDVEEL